MRAIKVFIVLYLLLLWAISALASQSIHVEWEYTPPSEPAVSGYQLYQNGQAVVIWPGATTTEGDVTLSAIASGDTFTLTALFTDSTESPHSAPYLWTGGASIKFVAFKPGNSHGRTNKPGSVRLR